MSNYFDLIKKLCYCPGVDEDPPTLFSDTDPETLKYKQYLNQALEEIFSEQWNFRKSILTFSTVAGTSAYNMPAGIIERQGVKVSNVSNPLRLEKSPYALSVSSGLPTSYYVYGSSLVLYPTPATIETVTVYYLNLLSGKTDADVLQAGLVLETDEPNIPVQFHDLVVRKAELIYMRDKATKNNAQARADANKRISQLIDLDRGTLEASPIIVMSS